MSWSGRIEVAGPPVAYGSKVGFVDPRTKRVIVKDDQEPAVKRWQSAARREWRRIAPAAPLAGGIEVWIGIYIRRPLSHFGTGKNAGILKPDAPARPLKPPDIDKVLRCAFDTLTGIVVTDDSHAPDATIRRFWTTNRNDPERVVVAVREI